MQVKLVWVTPDAEKLIAYCARVSNLDNQDNEEYGRLLRYCIRNGHWSIFEMANMCVEITTSRAISAQILRHRSFSFQEFSQRYAVAQNFENVDLRLQDPNNRQNSTDGLADHIKRFMGALIKEHVDASTALYESLLQEGVAKECARMVLPMTTQTKLYMNGTIRSWIHYLNLRTSNGTQQEHKEIAEAVKTIFKEELPTIAEALRWS
jgi:thymidylate synthase (FAD)